MPEVLRIALRLLGLVLLILGAVCLVLLIKPGPAVATRPKCRGSLTIDLSRRRRR